MNAAAIILSGGKSSRMGTNKALLKINEKTNIERIRDQLKNNFAEYILVTNHPEEYHFLNMNITSDIYRDKGPLAGIHAGLSASPYDVNFIVACDMPFVSGELANQLVHLGANYDAVIPVINGMQHPLFAVYHKRVIPYAVKSLEDNRLAIKALLDKLNVLYISEKELQAFCTSDLERVFFNMNHPKEYEDAKLWAKE